MPPAEPVTAEELERARTKWLKGWDQAFTDPETIGVSLSESVAQGDWRLFFLTRDRIRAATLADVPRVAEQRLLPLAPGLHAWTLLRGLSTAAAPPAAPAAAAAPAVRAGAPA